jgi:hypothetical protein
MLLRTRADVGFAIEKRLEGRVTRLGEFSPIRKLFTSDRVLKITEIA